MGRNGIPHNYWIQYPDLAFNEKDHEYQWKGTKKNSVTRVMDSIGTREWNDKEKDWSYWEPIGCPEFAKNKHDQNFGRALHKYIAGVFWDLELKYPDEMKPWVNQFERFLCDYPFLPLFDKNRRPIVEYPIFSKKYDYAGTIDFVGLYKTKDIWIIDWKASENYMQSYAWQTAAYEQLLREVFGGILFDKRAKISRKTVLITANDYDLRSSDNPVDWIMFQSFLNILRKK